MEPARNAQMKLTTKKERKDRFCCSNYGQLSDVQMIDNVPIKMCS